MLIKKQASVVKACILAAMFPLGAIMQAHAQDAASTEQPEPTYTIASNEVDVVELIKIVSAATGKTIVIDPAVKGKVQIMTNNNEMTKDELYELFRSVLHLSNFGVVEEGLVTKVLPLKETRYSPVGSLIKESGLSEVVTEVIAVDNISSAKLLAVLRPMVSTNGSIGHHDGSNSMIITSTKANIERIRRIIRKIDKAAVATTEVIQLKYAEAESLVTTLTKLSKADAQSKGSSNKLQMVADKRNNAILLSGEDLQRERVRSLIERLDRPQPQTGNVRVVYLEYADAVKVAETLSKVTQNLSKLGPGAGGKGQSGGGAGGATVEADEDTNSLLITAEGDTLTSLLAVIERLDIRRAQVLVEAIIVNLNTTDNKELGVDWLFGNLENGIVGGNASGARSGSLAPGFLPEGGGNPTIRDLGVGVLGTEGNVLGIAGLKGADKFLAILKALDNSENANILSTPSILTMDNNEAEISIGQEVPFVSGSFSSVGGAGGGAGGGISSPFNTITREDVGILLKITPQINEGDKVLMDIEQEVSSVVNPDAPNGPTTDQSVIKTQVLASDGEIVVLGGLTRDETTDSRQRVPLLGSIPLLGYFFKYQTTKLVKQSLVVFLRAKIIRDDEIMAEATAEKYSKIRDLQLKNRKRGLPLMRDSNIPVLPDIYLKELVEKAAAEEDY